MTGFRVQIFLLLVAGVLLLALSPLLFLSDTPTNDKPASLWLAPLVLVIGAGAFAAIVPAFSWWALCGVALFVGGGLANVLYRILAGPVPDYIPLPGGLYANLADVAIVLGVFVFTAYVTRELWRAGHLWHVVLIASCGALAAVLLV